MTIITAIHIIISVAGVTALAFGLHTAIWKATADVEAIDARLAAERKAKREAQRAAAAQRRIDVLTDEELDDYAWYAQRSHCI